MKVNLQKVIEAITFADAETEYYYSTKTEKVLMLFDGMVDSIENPELIKNIQEGSIEDYIPLPGQRDINEYRIMEEFISELPNAGNQNILDREIRGKGAFHRFKRKLHDLGLMQEWYRYREEAFERIAIKWCERYKIGIEEMLIHG